MVLELALLIWMPAAPHGSSNNGMLLALSFSSIATADLTFAQADAGVLTLHANNSSSLSVYLDQNSFIGNYAFSSDVVCA